MASLQEEVFIPSAYEKLNTCMEIIDRGEVCIEVFPSVDKSEFADQYLDKGHQGKILLPAMSPVAS